MHHTEANNDDASKTFETVERKENLTYHHEVRKGSSTIEADKFMNNRCSSNLKESNTSTSVGGEPDIKFSRRIRKFKDLVDSKGTKSQKMPKYEDYSELFPARQKARFYQHFNISQEEIDLKRRKFDSQFINKPFQPQTTKEISPEHNESEVTEDICKVETSQHLNVHEDTFEKGFVGNNGNNAIDESGTLYESVY
jgi:hypothetical protein